MLSLCLLQLSSYLVPPFSTAGLISVVTADWTCQLCGSLGKSLLRFMILFHFCRSKVSMQYSNICYVDFAMALKELFPFSLSEDAVASASENLNSHFSYLDLYDTINECFSYWIEDYL